MRPSSSPETGARGTWSSNVFFVRMQLLVDFGLVLDVRRLHLRLERLDLGFRVLDLVRAEQRLRVEHLSGPLADVRRLGLVAVVA
jgi:hypothetical protein